MGVIYCFLKFFLLFFSVTKCWQEWTHIISFKSFLNCSDCKTSGINNFSGTIFSSSEYACSIFHAAMSECWTILNNENSLILDFRWIIGVKFNVSLQNLGLRVMFLNISL